MSTSVLLKQARSDLRNLLDDGVVCLAAILEDKLPKLYIPHDTTWWKHRVDRHLSPKKRHLRGEDKRT